MQTPASPVDVQQPISPVPALPPPVPLQQPIPPVPALQTPSSPLTATETLPSAARWSVPIAASPAAPPVTDGEQIFVVLKSGVVASHRVSDGTLAWQTSLRSNQSVAVEGGRVYVAAGEAIHALKAADGSPAWMAPSGTVTAPLLAHEGWLIAATASRLTAFRTSDGSKVWARETSAQHVRPTIEGDNLYVPLDDGHLLALDLRTGANRWVKHFKGAASEVLAFSDRIYVGSADKWFYCFDAGDGRLEWKTRLGAVLRGRPAADDRHVFVTSMDNTLRAYDRSGALRWHPSVPYRPTTGPVIVASSVVVPGNAAELRAFEAATGKPAGKITLEEKLGMPPAFGRSADAVVMTALTGNLNDQWKLVLMAPPAPAPSIPHE
jgi:outer membrane protein assembly factor BamB